MAVFPPDSHIHTRFSFDSRADAGEICEAAMARGMREIAVTDHVDLNPLDGGYGFFRPEAHWQALREWQAKMDGRIALRIGLECGEPHRFREGLREILAAREYDVVLASIHWVGERPVENGEFFRGITVEEGISLYFEELAHMAEEADYDVLAHPDIIRRAVYHHLGRGEVDLRPFEAQVRRVLRAVAGRGKALELNTSFRRRGMGSPGPSVQVLRWFREEGGRLITLGSDAHRPQDVGADFAEAIAMVRAAGFDAVAVFRQRRPYRFPLG